MVTKEQALHILNKVKQNKPTNFFNKISDSEAGMRYVLVYLSEQVEEVYASTIAEKMKISRARVAVLIKKLENKRLINKTVCKTDARIEVLKITKRGMEEVNKIQENAIKCISKVIETLGIEEINRFIETSAKIKAVLDI